MFAGAAREAVFSQVEVIRRVQADFVPVALKAALVNNPPPDEEGQLYREIGRSKPAPQGICVVNSAGKVLDWALMFDDDKSVLAFLDHAQKRFLRHPDAKQLVAAERFMKFPSLKLDDVADTRRPLPTLDCHPRGQSCPATPPLPEGTMIARLVGRALDKEGKPVADTVRQEHYVEDRFHVSVELQDSLAKALTDAGSKRFRVPDAWARLLMNHAYLGQLDVNPVGAPGGKGSVKQSEFWAQRAETRQGTSAQSLVRLRLEGTSAAAGMSSERDGADGRQWQHEVTLTWEGWIDLDGNRVRKLLLVARGSEKLRWGNKNMNLPGAGDVANLPGGHRIDLACGVRYGIIAEPAPADQVAANAPPDLAGLPVAPVPDEALRQIVQTLGPTFLVFRAKVQDELKLSAEQREKLQERLASTVQDAQPFFQKLDDGAAADRDKDSAAYRQRAQEKLVAFLQGALQRGQLQRLEQLELQQQGLFALLNPDIAAKLEVTADQRRQFMAVIQSLQDKVQPLVKQAQAGANPGEIAPKIMAIRRAHERRLESILTEAQTRQWREMIGRLLDVED